MGDARSKSMGSGCGSAYDYILGMPVEGIGWEFLRRNTDFRSAWSEWLRRHGPAVHHTGGLTVRKTSAAHAAAARWGLVDYPAVEDDGDARQVDAIWRPDAYALALKATATAGAADRPDRLRLVDLPGRKTVLIAEDGAQHVLFNHEGRTVQLVCTGEDVLQDDIVLHCHLSGFCAGDRKVLAYQRLRSLWAHKRYAASLYKPASRAAHLKNALVALDGDLAGLSRRDIAIALYGERLVADQWTAPDGTMKARVRYAVKRGRALMSGGYRRLLQ